MTNILIRDLDPETVERLDKRAADLGLSRNELLRQRIVEVAAEGKPKVTRGDLERFTYLARDLLDDDVMRGAWE